MSSPTQGPLSSGSSSLATSIQMSSYTPVAPVMANIATVKMNEVKIVTDPMLMHTTNPPILRSEDMAVRDYLTAVHHTQPVVKAKLNDALQSTMQWVANFQEQSTDTLGPSKMLQTFLHADEKLEVQGLPIEFMDASLFALDPSKARPGELPVFPQRPHSQGFMFLTNQRVLLMATAVTAGAEIHRFKSGFPVTTTQIQQSEGCLCCRKPNPTKPDKYEVASSSTQRQWFFPIPLEAFHHFYFDGNQTAEAKEIVTGQVPDCCGLGLCKLGDKQWNRTGHQQLGPWGESNTNYRKVYFALDLPPWDLQTNMIINVLPGMTMRGLADWLAAFQMNMVRCKHDDKTTRFSIATTPSPPPSSPPAMVYQPIMPPPAMMRMA